MDRIIRIKAIVKGRVQGVGFRYYTKQAAEKFKLTGTVQNNEDGSVTTQFQGEEHNVLALLKWLHQGPPTSIVRELHYEEMAVINEEGFIILRI